MTIMKMMEMQNKMVIMLMVMMMVVVVCLNDISGGYRRVTVQSAHDLEPRCKGRGWERETDSEMA